MSARILIAAVLALSAVLSIQVWNAHLIAQGDEQGAKRVRGEWTDAVNKQQAEAALAKAEAERQAREEETRKQKEAERIAREQVQREATWRAAIDRANARNSSLLNTIADLNARDAARLSEAGTHPGSDADIDATTTARQLLGQCSQRYTAVAADADALAAKVTGLQDYVRVMHGHTGEQDADGF